MSKSKQNFEQLLKQHDWFFEYQDTFESLRYKEGKEEAEQINSILADNPDYRAVYNKYNPFNK